MLLRNNTTGEYIRFEEDDDPVAVALLDLPNPSHPTDRQWAQTGDEALQDAEAAGVTPSFAALIPPTAAAASDTQPLGTVQKAATVASAVYIPNADVVGAATNSRTIEVLDGGTTVASLALTAGVDLTEGVPANLTISSANVAEGDVLTAESLSVGTGLADPGGVVVVTFTGNESLTGRDFSGSDADAKDE